MKQPKIRFKGFEGEWKLVTFKDISNGFNYGINAAAKPFDGLNKYLRITDIDDSMRVFDTSNLTSPNAKDINMYLLQEGDITFARTGASVGKTYIYNKKDGKVVYAGFLIRMQLKDSVCPHFIFYNTLTTNYFNYINIVSQRSGQPGVNSKEYGDYSLNIPIIIKEQQAIAEYFKSLNSLIQTTTKKIASLKQMKSACLVSMFPQEGETKPRVRFKGFEGEWKKDKAINLFETFNIRNRPDLPVLSANQDIRGMAPRTETGYNISHDRANEVTYKVVKPGQFVIHLRSFQGGFAHSSVEGITSPAYTVFGLKDERNHDDYFWKIIFMSKTFVKRLETITYGIRDGRSISFGEFSEMPFLFPCCEEQQKIASFFSTLDTQISLQEQRLEKLKHIKSACLDKMFV